MKKDKKVNEWTGKALFQAILSSPEQKEKLLEVVKSSPELEENGEKAAQQPKVVSEGNYLYGGSIGRR